VALVERQNVLDLVAGGDDDRGVREADRELSVAFDDRDRGSYVGRRERFEVQTHPCREAHARREEVVELRQHERGQPSAKHCLD
jgi:hypothetical protein